MSASESRSVARPQAVLADFGPGILLAALVGMSAWLSALAMPDATPLPTMVLALLIGIAFNPLASRVGYTRGIGFCFKTVLRCAVALMGLRVSLNEIAALGTRTALLIVFAMAATIIATFLFARLHGKSREFGALVGVATAVCGASAALATATVLREYPNKQTEIAFVIVAVNALATLAILAYPPLCLLLGFDQQTAGVMLGGTIHDVAQVAGAGYALSQTAGNAAVVVKLFRVLLLLPVVFLIGLYFRRRTGQGGSDARVPVPLFAIVFLLLCIVNSAVYGFPHLLPAFNVAKDVLVDVSNLGLLLAISALGLSTSVRQIVALGWEHMSIVCGSAAVLLLIVTAGLYWPL